MNHRRLCFSLATVVLLATSPLVAQETRKSAESDRELLLRLLKRVDNLEQELKRLRKSGQQVIPADPKQQRLVVLLETPYLGAVNYRSTGARFFAARIVLINLTDKAVSITRESIGLDVNGQRLRIGELPAEARTASFQIGNQGYRLSSLKTASKLAINPGGTASTWVVFHGLPAAPQVPKLGLVIETKPVPVTLDINATAARRLDLSVRRIGPRRSLGLVTVSGSVDTINAGALASAIDQLASDGVVRVVIGFSKRASPLESRLSSWLEQSARQSGTSSISNTGFPTLPVSIRELHIAARPNRQGGNSVKGQRVMVAQQMAIMKGFPIPTGSNQRVHPTIERAVAAALASAFRALPRGELLKQILEGDPLVRPAALATGGGRLGAEHLDAILKLSGDEVPAIEQSALIALRHFGEPRSVARLVEVARKNDPVLGPLAIESLAASRFTAAHEALLGLLPDMTAQARPKIVAVLARHPRLAFADVILEYARADDETGSIALSALAMIGHPQLMPELTRALASQNSSRRNAAFTLLASRSDPESIRLATEHALERLKAGPPDSTVVSVISRTRDPRAIPLLLKHLGGPAASRSAVIRTLAQVGDERVVKELVKQYPELPAQDRATILQVLSQVDAVAFRKLAAAALASNDSNLLNVTCQALAADAGTDAVALLAKALESSGNTSTWSYSANALAQIGTPDARKALETALKAPNSNKRNYARNALRNLRQRSPGYQYVSLGRHYAQLLDWKQSLANYDMAIRIDPRLPAAHAGRGNANMNLDQDKKALVDFRKAVELEPSNSQAVTGLAIALVRSGDIEAGLKYAEDSRQKLTTGSNSRAMQHVYNLACVYSRTVEFLGRNPKLPNREQRIATFRKKAIADLAQAIKLGYSNRAWIKKDPDLKPLRDMPEFKKLLDPARKPPSAPGAAKRPGPDVLKR